MHTLYTIVIALSLLLVIGGCHNPITDPKPLMLETELSYGPEEYRQGYEDGCKSALGAYGTNYMKTIYGIQKTAQYQNSRMYNQIWKDAWAYCYMWYFVYNRKDPLYGKPIL